MTATAPRRLIPSFDDLSPIWRACVLEAWEAFRHGSLPIAAVVTDREGRIIARGRNRLGEFHESSPHLPGTPYLTGTSLAHAEVNALLDLGYSDASEVRLYTTTEPCPLCMGAARMASVRHVVYASRDPWAGCANMAVGVPYLARRGPTIEGPDPALETAFVAWQVSRHMVGESASMPEFTQVWRDLMPLGCAAGARLFESRALVTLAARGAEANEAWDAIRSHVDQADTIGQADIAS